MAVRLFNPETRLWSIYWADNNRVTMDPPQVGSFDGPIGDFLARDVLESTDVIVRFHWDNTDPDAPVWSQAFSTDEGGDLGMELVYAFHSGRREYGDGGGEIKKEKDYDNGKGGSRQKLSPRIMYILINTSHLTRASRSERVS
jgi:hypothetical protein